VRQTALSVARICEILDGRAPTNFRICLLINELGEIAAAGGPEAAEAEKKLIELLSSGSREDREIAYRWLIDLHGMDKASAATVAALRAFSRDPKNMEILSP